MRTQMPLGSGTPHTLQTVQTYHRPLPRDAQLSTGYPQGWSFGKCVLNRHLTPKNRVIHIFGRTNNLVVVVRLPYDVLLQEDSCPALSDGNFVPFRHLSGVPPGQEHRAVRRTTRTKPLSVSRQNRYPDPTSLGHFARPTAGTDETPSAQEIVQPGASWRFSHRARTSSSADSISRRSSTGISDSLRSHLARFRPTRSRSR